MDSYLFHPKTGTPLFGEGYPLPLYTQLQEGRTWNNKEEENACLVSRVSQINPGHQRGDSYHSPSSGPCLYFGRVSILRVLQSVHSERSPQTKKTESLYYRH